MTYKVWMLYNKYTGDLIFEVDASAKAVWQKAIENETMGTGVDRAELKRRGFAARRVCVAVLPPGNKP